MVIPRTPVDIREVAILAVEAGLVRSVRILLVPTTIGGIKVKEKMGNSRGLDGPRYTRGLAVVPRLENREREKALYSCQAVLKMTMRKECSVFWRAIFLG